MLKQINKIIIGLVFVLSLASANSVFALLSCSITTAAGCTGTVVLRMSSATNAHAESATGTTSGYANNTVCCTGVSGVACSGSYASLLKLSSSTNAHVEVATNVNYPYTACISSSGGSPVIAYQDTSCTGYDTTLLSISSTTNATVGSPASYTKKVCGSIAPASITFTISTTTIYFGVASPVLTRYASSTNTSGDNVEVEAHTLSVITNATNGYTLTAKGSTLTSATNTISAIGAVNTAPAVGTEQFGIRLVASGGSGVVNSPYSASGFAYGATATTSSLIANATVGDNATTTYSVRYVANIAPTTVSSAYTSNIIYVATANF
jgi:hypothetical protein